MSQSQRRFYRLRYPYGAEPQLRLSHDSYPVRELCEEGFRIGDRGVMDLAVGDVVSGELRFDDGESIRVAGIVQRHAEGEAVVTLTWGIPMQRVIAEQRRFIRRRTSVES